MVIGFTGTRAGMSAHQVSQLRFMLGHLRDATNEFHHGGARGADRHAADIARACGFQVYWHPCPGVAREHGDVHVRDVWLEVFPPLVRNRRIVDAVDVLVAAPLSDREELRSGTWATVRYANRAWKPVLHLSRGGMAAI